MPTVIWADTGENKDLLIFLNLKKYISGNQMIGCLLF